MKKIGVLTSGGDSPGMNAAVRAVVRSAAYHGIEVVGVQRGYDGLIENDFVPFESSSVANILQRGGTILKSMRSDGFRLSKGRKQAYENLISAGIEGLVVIGGCGWGGGHRLWLVSVSATVAVAVEMVEPQLQSQQPPMPQYQI